MFDVGVTTVETTDSKKNNTSQQFRANLLHIIVLLLLLLISIIILNDPCFIMPMININCLIFHAHSLDDVNPVRKLFYIAFFRGQTRQSV